MFLYLGREKFRIVCVCLIQLNWQSKLIDIQLNKQGSTTFGCVLVVYCYCSCSLSI